MIAIVIFQGIVTAYAIFWALYVLLIPLIAKARKSTVMPVEGNSHLKWPTIAVMIPTRNMANAVTQCIGALRACDYPAEKVDLYVIADHCSDDTTATAEAAGATVLTRTAEPRGKTYALAWGIAELTAAGVTPDLYVIVDAPVRVEPTFFGAMAASWRRGEDIITGCSYVSVANQKWYARCLGLMLVHRNLQNWAREQLGLSALIEGTGMAYSRRYIQQFGWQLALPTVVQNCHPTEDWRHGVRVVDEGFRVAVADEARAFTPWRSSFTEATKQGIRWERGRVANAATHALRLLWHGIQQRDWLKVYAALDSIQPPVAILGALSLFLAAASMITSDKTLGQISGLIPVVAVGLYGLGVAWQGRQVGIRILTVVWAPFYILWRCLAFILSWGFLDHFNLAGRRKPAGTTVPDITSYPPTSS